jgi:hypothetical protein
MSSENEKQKKSDPMFMSLLLSLEASAMQALGKMINPITNTTERNLDQARMTIDMIGMLENKTTGNLSEDEDNLLKRVLYQLRMNYLDERKKPEEETRQDSPEKQETSEDHEEKSEENSSGHEEKPSENDKNLEN